MMNTLCRLLLLFVWTAIIISNVHAKVASTSTSSLTAPRKLVIGVDGGTESIRACCFDASTGQVVGKSCAVPYPTHHPQPGWAEQNPHDWYENMGQAVRAALLSLESAKQNQDGGFEICALCVDTTCCSVVALDQAMQPLRNSLLWMDARSAPQTQEILDKCMGDPALDINCGGQGPLSAEWMIPKALWIQQTEPDTWKQAHTICEYQDFINYKLTGKMVASSCNAATRWHWNGQECIVEVTDDAAIDSIMNDQSDANPNKYPGRPLSLYDKLGIPELASKLPQKCLPMGSLVGHLADEAAKHLNLPPGLPIAQGGPDAFVGMIGLGCIHPGQLCLITGSSHLHCVVSSQPTTAPGTWGAYKGAPLPHLYFAEGGQSSTGSILKWCRTNIFGGGQSPDYKTLDDEASKIPAGCDGLVALETFQGSRTPITDPKARGALIGLSLSHTRAHIWRAWMEAVCFGTRGCIQDGLEKAGHECLEIIMAGGATRSTLWLQMHADVTGKAVIVCENADAPLLGCAILASVCVGIHDSIDDAVKTMVRQVKRIEPNAEAATRYTDLYNSIYKQVAPSVQATVHAMANLRGGDSNMIHASNDRQQSVPTTGINNNNNNKIIGAITISPSLLACNWARMAEEVQLCLDAGTTRLHVDILDGVFVDSPHAFTFGPQMVQAIRESAEKGGDFAPTLHLDLHMYVDRPRRFIDAMAKAGATTFIFQWEAVFIRTGQEGSDYKSSIDEAIDMAREIISTGMSCGICINPSTDVAEILPILESRLVSVVDVLAVEPGFGGQSFQHRTIDKIHELYNFRKANEGLDFEIMVDGGINHETIHNVAEYADIAVAGTFLFRHKESLKAGVQELLARANAIE